MPSFGLRWAALFFAWALPAVLTASCGNDEASGGGPKQPGGSTVQDSGASDAFYPEVEASDPCEVAGYFFDGESDCNVVRCPELTCECEPPGADGGAAALPAEIVTLSACVPESGCLDQADCSRVCNPALKLDRQACEARIQAAGSQGCEADGDCVVGECREESVGKICVDTLGCSEDGHCTSGSRCLFDPSTLDDETGFPTALGTCADGREGSRCFEGDDCMYGRCEGQRCTGGADGDTCTFNDNCASGFCRVYESTGTATEATGTCVSGEVGGSCVDDGDCKDALHCTGGVCASGAVGQRCESDGQCDSGICISGRCRAGQLGSYCEDDADCSEGVCAGYRCASGGFLSPCSDTADCQSGYRCARQVCTDGSAGAPCATDEDCSVRACVDGACSEGENGARCRAGADCKSNRCADPAGVAPGECTSGTAGSVCAWDDDCVSGDCVGTTCN